MIPGNFMTMQPPYGSAPPELPALSDCSFYHTIDIPGHGVQTGQWDLRPGITQYLGDLNFRGQRVLEIGTANGFICFEMERRGADVVAFDLAEDLTYDAPPHNPDYLKPEVYRDGLRRIRNAWWLTHAALGSKARVAYGHSNRIPATLGRFDVGVLANVMQHLQDPIGALMGLAAISDEAVVVTESDWMHGHHDDMPGMIYFDKDNPYVWYQVKPALVEAVLRRMGFDDIQRTEHRQLFRSDGEHTKEGVIRVETNVEVPHYTIIGRRSKVAA
jgi:SAM-dependent methyltransferase